MLRFGPAGIPVSSPKRDTVSGIKKVAELGLNAMEVEFVRGVRMSEGAAEEAGKIAKEINILLSAHAPYFINLASEDEKKREKSITFITDTAKIANALGAKIVVFHPGYYYKKDKNKTFSLMVENIKKAKKIVEENKWNVVLAPETMGRQATFGSLDEIISLCEEADVAPTIDFAHIHARGNGCLKTKDDFGKILDRVEKLGLKSLHMHFTGVEYKNGNEKKHLILEDGDLDFSLLAKELAERKINGTLINESPNLEADALHMKKVYERMK
ncbi:MAG: TIM barrel protein [Thermoplasmatales archaeon]|nr:TIM barrel protein [Thermoplasmatales archaeon]